MGLKLFNTLSRALEDFVPLDPAGKKVAMYCCGPTVYDRAHIGNFRTFVFGDLLRRVLEFLGFEVFHVMNITDVEDKIIARVRAAGGTIGAFTSQQEAAFWSDFDALSCLRPHAAPRATAHIPEIIDLIRTLVERGIAYQAPDRSVYFSIENYRAAGHRYGQLVNLNPDELRSGARVRNDEYAKESMGDFALWKARVPEDGEVFWKSPWGEGRPGWHIECSAMSMKELGPSFDLHLGGEDLIFPHHEDEIAQSEGAQRQSSGRPFVKYWVHAAHLLVEGKKMSKSLGNFYTLRDLLERGYTGREVRYALLQAHYREQFNFTTDGLLAARKSLGRLDEWYTRMSDLAQRSGAEEPRGFVAAFSAFLQDDLNVSGAWGYLFDQVREANRKLSKQELSPESAASWLKACERLGQVFGIELQRTSIKPVEGGEAAGSSGIPEEMLRLLAERQEARRAKNYSRADEIRNELKARGWVIEDTPQGARLKPI